MRVVFVYFGPFNVNSAIQAFHFGNELTEIGRDDTLAGVGDPGEISAVGEPRFECINHSKLRSRVRDWKREGSETVVVAWTPRERVRRLTLQLVRELRAPYTVHLEDNEWFLLETITGRTMEELRRLPLAKQDRMTPIDAAIHPTKHEAFMRDAAGVTVITEELNEFNLAGVPHAIARPGIDTERFRPDLEPPLSRAELGLSEEDFVLVYHGTVHYANQHEMLSLYLAVKLLQRRGRRVRLVRLGHTEFGGVDPSAFRAVAEGATEVGIVPWREIPNYLALADAFVQPGPPNDFNRYRLPSKLPEFLAMGRPVILPHCNIGNDLSHGENALLLERGNALDIAERVEELLDDHALAERLGRGARSFALEELSWERNAQALGEFLAATIREPVAGRAA
jgi:glycosyltransferase involved in cell wall biosynthesis